MKVAFFSVKTDNFCMAFLKVVFEMYLFIPVGFWAARGKGNSHFCRKTAEIRFSRSFFFDADERFLRYVKDFWNLRFSMPPANFCMGCTGFYRRQTIFTLSRTFLWRKHFYGKCLAVIFQNDGNVFDGHQKDFLPGTKDFSARGIFVTANDYFWIRIYFWPTMFFPPFLTGGGMIFQDKEQTPAYFYDTHRQRFLGSYDALFAWSRRRKLVFFMSAKFLARSSFLPGHSWIFHEWRLRFLPFNFYQTCFLTSIVCFSHRLFGKPWNCFCQQRNSFLLSRFFREWNFCWPRMNIYRTSPTRNFFMKTI